MISAQLIFPDSFQFTANNMAVNWLRRARDKFTNHVLDFSKQTVLHGVNYCINRGTIQGSGTDAKTGKPKTIFIKISKFDRLVG